MPKKVENPKTGNMINVGGAVYNKLVESGCLCESKSPKRKSPCKKKKSPKRKSPCKKSKSPKCKSPCKKKKAFEVSCDDGVCKITKKSSCKKSPKRKSSCKKSSVTTRLVVVTPHKCPTSCGVSSSVVPSSVVPFSVSSVVPSSVSSVVPSSVSSVVPVGTSSAPSFSGDYNLLDPGPNESLNFRMCGRRRF